jgi:hypothetical protein
MLATMVPQAQAERAEQQATKAVPATRAPQATTVLAALEVTAV